MRKIEQLPETADVVVIGGGVIGAACAWWLERAGRQVLLLEARSSIGSYTTPNALGTIRTQYGSPTLVTMAQESLAFHRQVEEHLGAHPDDVGWANQGYLYLTENADHVPRLHESLAEYEALGVTSSRVVEEPELSERFPFAGSSVAAILHADGSWVDPARITHAWAAACATTDVLVDTPVEHIEATGAEWEVVTAGGAVRASTVVVAAGPRTPALLDPFGVDAPVKITPRYRAFIPFDDAAHAAAPLVINIVNGAYWRPVPGGVWLSTANVDHRSVEPGDTVRIPSGFLDECLEQMESVSPDLVAHARSLDPNEVTYAGGFQSYPADDIPIIDAIPGAPGLFANYGHWAGVMLAPASGRLLTDLVSGAIGNGDNPCSLGRFNDPAPRSSTNKFGGWG
ncbi:MAG: NAD(P)/FAD-dependent oxidoreductase [Acidimicrobiales bacterium]